MKKRSQPAFGVAFRNWDRKKCTLTAEALQELPRRWELNIIAIAMKMAVEYAFAQLIVRSSVDHQLFGFNGARRGRKPDGDNEGVLHEVERALCTAHGPTACTIRDYYILEVLKRLRSGIVLHGAAGNVCAGIVDDVEFAGRQSCPLPSIEREPLNSGESDDTRSHNNQMEEPDGLDGKVVRSRLCQVF